VLKLIEIYQNKSFCFQLLEVQIDQNRIANPNPKILIFDQATLTFKNAYGQDVRSGFVHESIKRVLIGLKTFNYDLKNYRCWKVTLQYFICN